MNTPDPAAAAARWSAAMRSAIAGLDALSLIAEATAGYRKKLVDGGVGPEAADEMSKEYHAVLIDQMRTSIDARRPQVSPPIMRRDHKR